VIDIHCTVQSETCHDKSLVFHSDLSWYVSDCTVCLSQWFIIVCLWLYCMSITVIYHGMSLTVLYVYHSDLSWHVYTMINHCDRCITQLSYTDISFVLFRSKKKCVFRVSSLKKIGQVHTCTFVGREFFIFIFSRH
jgi:hypothetical protein